MTLRTLLTLAVLCTSMATPALADDRTDARRQVEFGIEVAGHGLWNEAIYRWERAVESEKQLRFWRKPMIVSCSPVICCLISISNPCWRSIVREALTRPSFCAKTNGVTNSAPDKMKDLAGEGKP